MLKGNDLMIEVTTIGALPDAPHAQHIHIVGANTCPAPTMKGTGYQGAIRTLDAADSYGAVKVLLTAKPGKTDASATLDVPNFPVGNAEYERRRRSALLLVIVCTCMWWVDESCSNGSRTQWSSYEAWHLTFPKSALWSMSYWPSVASRLRNSRFE